MKERTGHPGPHPRLSTYAAVVGLVLSTATTLRGQQAPADTAGRRPLSLAHAVQLADKASEQVQVARAEVTRAQGGQQMAQAARLPRIDATASYTRTLASQFRQAFQSAAPDSGSGSGPFGGADFGSLGFGSENTYNLGLSVSWRVFDGGSLAARSRAADASHDGAEIALASARAQLVLDVTTAYYDAQLAQRMVDIARAALEQADATLRQAREQEAQGNEAEFDVLRARVERDNHRPELIRRQSARDVAFYRLKQLLDLPLDEPLRLTDALEAVPAPDADTSGAAPRVRPGALEGARAPVRQAEAGLTASQGQLDQAERQRFPGVSVTSSYGRVAYPRQLSPPAWGQFRTNWTVGVALDVPIFDGGRIGADRTTARAGVAEARARLEQAKERAALDTYQALAALDAARASWDASSGTVEQAERAYRIAEIRFREGLSTQVELSDARLLLEQARGNRAQAARDLQVATTRVRLLPDLPLSGTGGGVDAASSGTAAQTSGGASTRGPGSGGAAPPGGASAIPGGVGRPGGGS